MAVQFRREDGTFVITHPVTGFPYHVIPDDPLYDQMSEEAASAPLEEPPHPTSILVRPEPTKEELLAQLQALAAKIEALP